jgi:hypothetical protein
LYEKGDNYRTEHRAQDKGDRYETIGFLIVPFSDINTSILREASRQTHKEFLLTFAFAR